MGAVGKLLLVAAILARPRLLLCVRIGDLPRVRLLATGGGLRMPGRYSEATQNGRTP